MSDGAPRSVVLGLALVCWTGLAMDAWADPRDEVEALREQALDLVNRAREAEGLEPLEPGENLAEAAQAHAEDMLARGYYAHESPEGDTVQDRYLDAGGGRWELVAENIARCEGCEPPATEASVERLHEGWMDSPPHRAAILAPGLSGFGFGLALDEGELYAVQTFAGPGLPRGLQPGEEEAPLAAEDQLAWAVRGLNRARERAGVSPVEPSEPLTEAARRLLPPEGQEEFELAAAEDLFALLPEGEREAWSSLSVVAGACGGCGPEPVTADLRDFRNRWLEDPGYRGTLLDPEITHAGFILEVDGEGRKIAVLVVGQRR